MVETAYDSEDVLQSLLAKFPDVLGGDQLAGDVARRWLLVRREAALPAEEGGAGRWSVDHLFLDRDAVPTIVEVKRSSDTRIRREVVGQLLEYAANAVVYWPIEALRTAFERRCEQDGSDADAELEAVLDADADVDGFWELASANLKAGRIRLVFVADEIPRELRRVVEFLNEQMTAEVIAIEVKQYVGEGLRTLVPRVIGLTAASETRKGRRDQRQWDEASFFTELEAKRGSAEAAVARELLEWARIHMPRFWWGKGKVDGSFIPVLDHNGHPYSPLAIYTNGKLYIRFSWINTRPPFNDPELLRGFLAHVNAIPGVHFPADAVSKAPSIELSLLAADPAALESLKNALDWFCKTVRTHTKEDAPAPAGTPSRVSPSPGEREGEA